MHRTPAFSRTLVATPEREHKINAPRAQARDVPIWVRASRPGLPGVGDDHLVYLANRILLRSLLIDIPASSILGQVNPLPNEVVPSGWNQ